MRVDDKLLSYLEDLSCITLSNDDKDHLIIDLEKTLNYMARISEVDTNGVNECSHPFDNVNVFRDDEVRQFPDRGLILENAPDHNDEAFIAPKTVE